MKYVIDEKNKIKTKNWKIKLYAYIYYFIFLFISFRRGSRFLYRVFALFLAFLTGFRREQAHFTRAHDFSPRSKSQK